ncbi:hypothetical protein JCM15519_10010 [Fundidesulfovibrio butyratiphilus]
MKFNLGIVSARKMITKSKLPGAEYVVNPYIGCTHGCAYCYARFMGRFTGHAGEPWGSYLDIKSFDSGQLLKDFARLPKGVTVFLGSVTDAYQQIERREKKTRAVLELAALQSVQLSTLTKSDLVLRDLDLWRRLKGASVGFSFSMLDDASARLFERRTSRVRKRMEAMRRMHEEGIDVYAFIGPILPLYTDLKPLMTELAGSCSGVMAEVLNLRCGNRSDLEDALARENPEKARRFFALARDTEYWMETRRAYEGLCSDLGLQNLGFFDHSGATGISQSEGRRRQ